MFQHRSSAFGPSVSVIQHHLSAIEKELERVGQMAGRRTSIAALAASEQIGDAISTILNDMLDRFRKGGRLAGDEAARYGNQAVKLGARVGSGALQRVSAQAEDRPVIALAVAFGIGILIGAAVLKAGTRN